MSENKNLLSLKDLVVQYYNIYKEYEKTFYENEPKKEEIAEKFKPFILNNDSSSDEYIETAKKLYIDRSIRWYDLMYHKTKFLNTANAFALTSEESLPEDIYNTLLKEKEISYKPFFAVEKGKFVETVKQDARKIPQQEYDNILKQVENEMKLYESK